MIEVWTPPSFEGQEIDSKIKRFTEALAKGKQTIHFWNELAEDLEGRERYIAELEQTITQLSYRRALMLKSFRVIEMAKRTLKQAERLTSE